jgi:hypothetical protein
MNLLEEEVKVVELIYYSLSPLLLLLYVCFVKETQVLLFLLVLELQKQKQQPSLQ